MGVFVDKVLDRNAGGFRAVAVVAVAALLATWLTVELFAYWRGVDRNEDRQTKMQQAADLLNTQAMGSGMSGAVSLLGLYLLVQGYGQARLDPVALWTPPRGMQHATILLMWVAMVLLVATYVPGNQIKAKLRHPMTLSVKVWALGHLLSNGNLADVLLFGGFLVWSVLVFRAARKRDRQSLHSAPEGKLLSTLLAVVVGTGVWAAFLMGGLHLWLVGVMPFTRAV